MNRTLRLLALASLAGSLFTGCKTNAPSAYVPLTASINSAENHGLIVLIDARIQYQVSCTGIQQQITPDGRLDISATFRNRENHGILFQANCTFKDDHGKRTEKDGLFQNVMLNENEQQPLHFTAANTGARRFTIHLRQAP